MKAKTWFLCNFDTKFVSPPMDTEGVLQSLSKMTPDELAKTSVWQPHWTEWKQALQVEELFPKPQTKQETKVDVAQVKEFKDRRNGLPRIKAKLRVIIRNDQITFRTFSNDISLSGVSLENPIPEQIYNKNCKILIADPKNKENIKFTLKLTSREGLKYFSFDDVDSQHLEKLKSWLQGYKKVA